MIKLEVYTLGKPLAGDYALKSTYLLIQCQCKPLLTNCLTFTEKNNPH